MGSSGSGLRFFFTLTVMVSLMMAFMLDVAGGPAHGKATQETTRTHELLSLQLSKDQVQSGSLEGEIHEGFLGSVGYIQGSFDGHPVTYIYFRYRAENGDIIDRLIPRDDVRLRDDLAAGEAATLEIQSVKSRKATYQDIQQHPELCHNDSYIRGFIADMFFDGEGGYGSPVPAEKCGRHADEKPEDWNLDREDLVVHVPKDSIIVTINPNMVPESAKKS